MDPLTPEEQQKLFEMLSQADALSGDVGSLDAQLEQARALQQPSNREYYGAGAGIIGGLGDVLRQIGGAVQQNRFGEQKHDKQKQLSKLTPGIGLGLNRLAYGKSQPTLQSGMMQEDATPYYLRQPGANQAAPQQNPFMKYFGFGG